jgi:hypothetical protein
MASSLHCTTLRLAKKKKGKNENTRHGLQPLTPCYARARTRPPTPQGSVNVIMVDAGGSNNSAPGQRYADKPAEPMTMCDVTGNHVAGAVRAEGGQAAFNEVTNSKARAFVLRQEREIKAAEEASNLKAERDRQRATAQITREGMQLDASTRMTAQSLQSVATPVNHRE